MHRLRVRLRGHMVMFDPPQHVATLAVERESDGDVIELMPTGGEEVDDGVAVLRRLPTSSSVDRTDKEEHDLGPGISRRYLDRLPLVGSIDLSNLPADYKRTSSSTAESLEFTPGERYVVTLVSEVTLKRTVIAE